MYLTAIESHQAMISEVVVTFRGKRKNLIEEKFGAWEADLKEEERKKIEDKLPTHLLVLYRRNGYV